MATSIRDLKKEVKYMFGDLVEQVLLLNLAAEKPEEKNHKLVDEIVQTYEEILKKINAHRKEKDKKAYFKTLNAEIDEKFHAFQEKINAL